MRSLYLHPDLTREDVITFQNKQLRRLIQHVYNYVPYYRGLFKKNNLKPDDVQNIDDLAAVPVTSKSDILSLPVEEILTQGVDPKQLIIHRTSGSSGEPLKIRRTWWEERLIGIFRRRAMHYHGLRITDKMVRVVLNRQPQSCDKQIFHRIFQILGLYREEVINCLQEPDNIVNNLLYTRPDVLKGYPGVLARIAEFIKCNNYQHISPRFVVSGGGVLTTLMRSQITECFSAPIYEIYGSHEFGLIAWECKKTSELHTCDDGVIVEVLWDGLPVERGERGEVVVTNLHAFTMPFIRYRLGDIVTKGSETCQCGQPFSTIKTVQGRMLDYFILPGGRVIHPYEITVKIMDRFKLWLRQFQLIQERENLITLYIVPSNTITPEKILQLEEAVRIFLGQEVEFKVIQTPEIKLQKSGKFRVARSLVQSDYDEIRWE